MKKSEHKVAIITGAASGIGKAMTFLFVSNGYKVIAADINTQKLSLLQQETEAMGGEIITVVTNMAKSEDIDTMFSTALEHYGTVDTLINNAGIMDDFSPVGETDEDMLLKVLNINLIGPFIATKKAINIMLTNGGGNIINIASVAGLYGSRAGAAYTTSKHGLIGLTKNTAFMYAKKGIRCNAIAPGGVETTIGESEFMKKTNTTAYAIMEPGMLTNPRSGKPIEIAQAALFLASEEASFINGTILTADGGWTSY